MESLAMTKVDKCFLSSVSSALLDAGMGGYLGSSRHSPPSGSSRLIVQARWKGGREETQSQGLAGASLHFLHPRLPTFP